MSQANRDLVEKFYSAFLESDAKTMNSWYSENAEFSDPVFPHLKGDDIKAMWSMLCQRKAEPGSRSFSIVEVNETSASINWSATYKFPLNGRLIHNEIQSVMTFSNGKIIKHVDRFDFWKWSRQAFGLPAMLFGWSWPFQSAVQKSIDAKLREFIKGR